MSLIMQRKQPLEVGEVYHVLNKSIAGFKIFNSLHDYQRMLHAIEYFSISDPLPKFSYFLTRAREVGKSFESYLDQCYPRPKRQVQIIAYCLMPTHFHLILIPMRKDGISHMMHNVLTSYSHYFNLKHKRKGPLWVGPFKNVLVESDEQLLHLTRYLHLNPATANLVTKPEHWKFSSYHEYITPNKVKRSLCQYKELMEIKPLQYQSFVNDQADYQRELAKIKHLIAK